MTEQPKTMSVAAAGKLYYGLSRNGSYAAAYRGDLVVIRVGNRLRVVVAAQERKLAEAGNGTPAQQVEQPPERVKPRTPKRAKAAEAARS